MRKITVLISLLYMLIALEFDTTVRNISNLDFNIYLSFMISGALELPADLLSIIGLNYLGRRWSSSISLFACGITILPCAWLAGNTSIHQLGPICLSSNLLSSRLLDSSGSACNGSKILGNLCHEYGDAVFC